MTDLNSLLSRIALKDPRAPRDLFDATARRLLAVAHRVPRDQAAAKDVLQELFVTLRPARR
jgi:RNA polymerase sigma-70 factor, ECF subfamily